MNTHRKAIIIAKMSTIEQLEWDSQFFGYAVGRVSSGRFPSPEQASATVQRARREGFRCVYLLADGGDAATWSHATAVGFRPVDIRLELESLISGDVVPGDLADGADEQTVIAIARANTFTDSRFFRDASFGEEKARRLFEIWASRGIHEHNWFTSCVRQDRKIVAFVTARLRGKDRGSIELVAVAEEMRGQGLGHRVLKGALGEFSRRGVTRVSVVTQGSNVAAQRLYAEHGFRVTSCGLWLHLWC